MSDVKSEVPADGSPAAVWATVQQDLDRISLGQALLDADIATSRVVDLSRRLVEANDRIARLEAEVARLQAQHAAVQEELRAIVSTKAFRIADRLWAIRRAVRG
ncbi:MAG: hypothetical protein ACRDJO_08895 [Actinomycetota bacterium]